MVKQSTECVEQDMPKIGCVNHDCDKCKEQGEREAIAVWLEQDCEEQYLADRVRAGDFAKEKGHTENCAALGDDCPDHLPPSLVGVGENNSTTKQEQGEKFCDANCVWTNHHPDCELAQQEQSVPRGGDPVGEVKDLFTTAAWEKLDVRGSTKVYLEAPQQRKPLTDDEAFALVQQDYRMEEYARAAVKLIRRTEAAHGIKENT
jgi:hypothetical protein